MVKSLDLRRNVHQAARQVGLTLPCAMLQRQRKLVEPFGEAGNRLFACQRIHAFGKCRHPVRQTVEGLSPLTDLVDSARKAEEAALDARQRLGILATVGAGADGHDRAADLVEAPCHFGKAMIDRCLVEVHLLGERFEGRGDVPELRLDFAPAGGPGKPGHRLLHLVKTLHEADDLAAQRLRVGLMQPSFQRGQAAPAVAGQFLEHGTQGAHLPGDVLVIACRPARAEALDAVGQPQHFLAHRAGQRLGFAGRQGGDLFANCREAPSETVGEILLEIGAHAHERLGDFAQRPVCRVALRSTSTPTR